MRGVETEVQELARLALGRVHYEQGNYEDAQRYYQDIRAESAFFTEQLYELVWTYVRQEKWLICAIGAFWTRPERSRICGSPTSRLEGVLIVE